MLQGGVGVSPRCPPPLREAGFSIVKGVDLRGDALWAESLKDAADKINQSASFANPGCIFPLELFTGKKGPFLVVPFAQHGYMRERRLTKLDDRAVPRLFLNRGDNHADICVKVMKLSTGRVCYSSNVAWASLPPSGGGEQASPSAAAPPMAPVFEIVQQSSIPAAASPPVQPPAIAHPLPPPPPPSPAPPAGRPASHAPSPGAAGPSRGGAASTSTASPESSRSSSSLAGASASASSPRDWPPSPIEAVTSTPSPSQHSPACTPPAPRKYRQPQPPPTALGYSSPLTSHATRQLGERGDRRIQGRTRGDARTIAQRELPAAQEEAVSTLLPQPSTRETDLGLLSLAGDDVLLPMLQNNRALKAKRTLLDSGGLGGGGEQPDRTGGVEECKGDPSSIMHGGNCVASGWSLGHSGSGVPLGLVARLASREDIDAALHEMRPPHLRPDMPLCHAKDLRVPKSFKEAYEGEHSVQFMDAAKREIFGLREAGAFEVVAE